MDYFYSKSTGGFYTDFIRGDYEVWPEDAVKISNLNYENLLSGQAAGKIINSDDKGYPVLVDAEEISSEQLQYKTNLKYKELMGEATQMISILQNAKDMGIATDNELVSLSDWKKYQIYLNRVDKSDPDKIEWPVFPS